MFIFENERERGRAQVGEGQRERETQNLKQAQGSELLAQSLMQGLNHKIMTLTDWVTQVPQNHIFKITLDI